MRRRSTLTATKARLTELGKIESALGSAALVLAGRLDDPDTPGSAVAAIGKELRAMLTELEQHATVVADPIDELKARREKRQRGSA